MIGERLQSAAGSPAGYGYLEHSQLQHLLLQPCGPVQPNTAQGKWCVWNIELEGALVLCCTEVRCDRLDI